MSKIFISYRRAGGDVTAKLISEALKNRGHKTFYDYDAIKGGVFDEQIKNEILECTDMVLILPVGALDRCKNVDDWVRIEISIALENEKNIIPVFLDEFEFPDELPEDIDDVRRYSGVRFQMDYFDAVIDKIEEKLTGFDKKYNVTENGEDFSEKNSHTKSVFVSDERKSKKEKSATQQKSKPVKKSNKQTVLTAMKYLFFFVAIALSIVAIVLFVDDMDYDIMILCGALSELSLYVGAIFSVFCGKDSSKLKWQKMAICRAYSVFALLFALLVGLIFCKYYMLWTVMPFVTLYLVQILYFHALANHYKKETTSGTTSAKPRYVIAVPVLGVIVSFVLFVGVFPFYYKVQDKYEAEQGDSNAQYYIGFFYEHQMDDVNKAVSWYSKAVNQGHKSAAYSLGKIYSDDKYIVYKADEKSVDLFIYSGEFSSDVKNRIEKTCVQICPNLMSGEVDVNSLEGEDAYYMGVLCAYNIRQFKDQNGKDVTYEYAHRLLEKASGEGNASASFLLGRLYENGIGVVADKTKAATYFVKAKNAFYKYNVDAVIDKMYK